MLLGDFLRSNGFVAAEAILECVDHQQRAQALGETPPRLGRLLVDRGHIDAHTLEEALSLHIARLPHPGASHELTGRQVVVRIGLGRDALEGRLLLPPGRDLGWVLNDPAAPAFIGLQPQVGGRCYVNRSQVRWLREIGEA